MGPRTPLSEGFKRFCLGVTYNGSKYRGWMSNPSSHVDLASNSTTGQSYQSNDKLSTPCVVEHLEQAIKKYSAGQYQHFKGSSRTDRGVHAIRNTCQVFVLPSMPYCLWLIDCGQIDIKMRPEDYLRSKEAIASSVVKGINYHLNSSLPSSLAVVDAVEVDEEFDARRSAIARTYMYRIVYPIDSKAIDHSSNNTKRRLRSEFTKRVLQKGPEKDVLFQSPNAWILKHSVDLSAMRSACRHLTGEHDFSSFQGARCQSTVTKRRIKDIRIISHREEQQALARDILYSSSHLLMVRY